MLHCTRLDIMNTRAGSVNWDDVLHSCRIVWSDYPVTATHALVWKKSLLRGKFIAKVGEVTKEMYVFDLRKGVKTQKLRKIELRKN